MDQYDSAQMSEQPITVVGAETSGFSARSVLMASVGRITPWYPAVREVMTSRVLTRRALSRSFYNEPAASPK